ncbi:esterase/lipase family protein [Nonomuraea sp. NPDC049646]|uniref:esterase/lipase family protein n=1 Tax=unclassified Nonomuraea TaxID=2593643 RepID=UPI00379EAFD3
MIVVIPGILGSVLERGGKRIWDHSLAAMRHVLPPRRLVSALSLDDGDDVRPVGLINGLHIVPGLWGIDGYGPLLGYLRRQFDVSRGNLISFPYDWRLSCAVNARRLGVTVERELTRLREHVPTAKVTYICHSMGGLIARYYLEVLGGRASARRLITIGTPHQGAAKAAAALCLGLAPGARARVGRFGRVLDDLDEVVRTFPSVYELLPTYRCVDDGTGELRHLLGSGVPIDTSRIREGATFHRDIALAAQKNGPSLHETYLFGGHRHKTVLSLQLTSAQVVPLHTWNGEAVRGDGTVPRFATALPEATSDTDVRYSGDRHSVLAGAKHLLDALHAILTSQPIRKYQGRELGLGLDLPELVPMGEAVPIEVEAADNRLALIASAAHYETGEIVRGLLLRNLGDGRYATDLILPKPGAWRVTVSAPGRIPVEPVSDIVMAVDPM